MHIQACLSRKLILHLSHKLSPIPACHPYCRSIQNEALCSIHYMALQRPILALQHCMEAVDMPTTSAGGKMAASCSDAAVQTNAYIPHIYLIVQCCYWNMQVTAKCTHSSSTSKGLFFTCALYTYCLPFLQLLLSPI